jgi:hypothetical protein
MHPHAGSRVTGSTTALPDRGEHAASQTTWGERMSIVPGVERRKSDGRKRYAGVALKPGMSLRLDPKDRAPDAPGVPGARP